MSVLGTSPPLEQLYEVSSYAIENLRPMNFVDFPAMILRLTLCQRLHSLHQNLQVKIHVIKHQKTYYKLT